MAIAFRCTCGAACSAEESRAGQLFHCEACGLDVPVPAPTPAGEAASAEAAKAAEAAEAAKRQQSIEALHEQLGRQGGRGEIQQALVEAEDPHRRSAREAFQQQLGQHVGAAEMITQITGVAPAAPAVEAPAGGAATVAPSDGPAVAPAAPPAVPPARFKPKRPAEPRPPTGTARAIHHIGFKRVMWLPSLTFGVVCAAVGLFAIFWPHNIVKKPNVNIREPEIVADVQGELWSIPRGTKAQPRADGTMGFTDASGEEAAALKIVKDAAGRAWAVPPGQKTLSDAAGLLYVDKETGFEIRAESAEVSMNIYEQEQKLLNYKGGREHGYLMFGLGLLAVALILAVLSLWMWHDVRTVARADLPVAEEVPMAAPASPAAPAETAPPAPAVDPTGGEGPKAASE